LDPINLNNSFSSKEDNTRVFQMQFKISLLTMLFPKN
jgi:hypothetical protein